MATYYATAATPAAISSKMAEIPVGDLGHILELPVDAQPFTSGIAIPDNKVIQIRTALGSGSTILTPSAGIICFTYANASQITGIGFVLDADSTRAIKVTGQDFRINENNITSAYQLRPAVWVSQNDKLIPVRGVIYQNTYTNCQNEITPAFVGTETEVMNSENYLWSLPSWIGTENMVFIEDNIAVFNDQPNFVESNHAGSYVCRYNHIHGTSIGSHSFQSWKSRATRIVEAYGNHFYADSFDCGRPWQLRAGELVIFDNVIHSNNGYGWTKPYGVVDDIRGVEWRFEIGISNGAWPLFDGNEAETNGTGMHTGSSGASGLTDSSKTGGSAWSVNQFVRPASPDSFGVTFSSWIYNLTSGASAQITANGTNTVTAALTGGSRPTWSAGDSYKVTSGYPARDQIGRGQDSVLSTGFAGSSQWGTQASVPCYAWNNCRSTAPGVHLPLQPSSDYPVHIVEGRDFFNGTARPGYTPYTYPHPRRSGSGGSIPTTTTYKRRGGIGFGFGTL